ncbi:MAG: 50S ribosomal protein L11 methyltransferase [Chloroflexi bacterium]|nr:50S ribosomal protein L11 methyltransferase [Chloroflexota bacterium]MCY3582098.1 50S ribosomal protein L11 methyltransferase [Chloroflexota bacterium]
MSRWIEVSLRVDGESAEAIAEVLGRYGHQGVSLEQADIRPDTWDEADLPPADSLILRAYFPDDVRAAATKAQLEAALGHMRLLYPMPEPVYRLVREDDWSQAWKAHYQPLRIGRRLLVRPRWVDVALSEGDIDIALDPGMAFGTGTHPTTQLCLEGLERVVQPGQIVLDLGCGSGILSIAAVKLGARRALALDIDAIAVSATRENASYNQVAQCITAQQGSIETALSAARRFDVLLVNILARVIMQLAAQGLGEVLRPGGVALFSGIIAEQADEVSATLGGAGLQIVARHQQGDWLLFEARRRAE